MAFTIGLLWVEASCTRAAAALEKVTLLQTFPAAAPNE